MSGRRVSTRAAPVQVTTRGDVPEDLERYAEARVGAVYRSTAEPILSARVVLTLSRDPARQRPAVAEASLDYDAARVRAQAAASEMAAAIDMVAERLRRRILQHHQRELTRHRWVAAPEARPWRHGNLPSAYLNHFRRPAEEREVLRRKTFGIVPMTVDEAAFDMEQMDYQFYLFVDVASGHDALVHRTPEGGYAVRGDVARPATMPAEVEYEGPAPVYDEEEARAHLDLGREPFVFYVDRETGRGRLLYTRYDGHYGLVLAA